MNLRDDLFADEERYPPWPVCSRSVCYTGPEILAGITAVGTLLGGTAATVGAVDQLTASDPEVPKIDIPKRTAQPITDPNAVKKATEARRRRLSAKGGRASTLLGGASQPLGA